jgi:hypothetical protein
MMRNDALARTLLDCRQKFALMPSKDVICWQYATREILDNLTVCVFVFIYAQADDMGVTSDQ